MDKVLNFLSLASAPSYTITGNYNYFLEVSIKGDSPYQTSTISLTAFTKSDKKIAIAVSCKWYRVLSDRQYRLATIHSNAYQLSAEDLGYTLKIEVTPQEEDQTGTAIVQYGPIRIDPNIRSTLENILGAGGSRFPIQLVDEDTGATSREPAALSMTSEYIRIVETPPVGKEKEVKFRYNYDVPKVELNYLDTNRLYFLFTGEEEDCEGVKKFLGIKKGVGCKLGIKLISRTARDLLILAIKCFATKNYMVNSSLINEVVFCPGKIFKEKKDAPQQIGDTILEVDSMKREMYLVLLRNQELSKDKERLQVSVKRLEEELSGTIETYSQLINEVRTNSDISQTTESAGEYRKRAENLEEEVKKLRRRIQEMEEDKILTEQAEEKRTERPRRTASHRDNDEIVNIGNDFQALAKKKEEMNLFSLEYEMKLHDLEEENEKLRSKNESLLDELREAREMVSRPTEPSRGSKPKNPAVDESFFMIENKLSDTKRLNELLIKQVHDLKAKNSTVTKELDTLKAEVLELRAGSNTEQQTKEKFYKQEKEALEKELQRVKQENSKLMKEKAVSVPASERDRLEDQSTQLSKRIEGLQRENNELKEKYELLERQQARNSVNVSQSGSVYSTPVRRGGDPFDFERNRENMSEEMTMRIKGELDTLRRDAVNWKSKSTNLEMELEKLRRENNEMREKLGQTDTLNMSGLGLTSPSHKKDYMGYLDRSMTNTSRTYEALLADAKKENDRLYGEIGTLKANLITTEFSLQMMTKDLERVKGSPSEHELSRVRKEVESLREENERLRTEVGLLRATVNKQVSVEERDRILIERDRLRGEVESVNKEKASWAEFRERSNEVQWKLDEKIREIDMLNAEVENYRTKNASLVKEAEYLREEAKRNKRKEQSMLDMSGMMGQDNEYKAKYEQLEEQYKKLEMDLDAMRNASFSRRRDDTEELQQMNELLRKEVMEYKKRLEESEQQGRRSVRNVEVVNPVDEELRKRNKALEVEMQNQRGRIADLEKENERFRLMGSLRESTNDDSFSRSAKKGKEDVEKLKNENENLLLQRNQLSKKVESLVKELESKVGVKTNQAMLENLAKTNERLIQENARLMDELDAARYGSRLENSRLEESRFEDNDKERMQQELMMVRAERDQLLVEVSKIKAVEKNKRIFG